MFSVADVGDVGEDLDALAGALAALTAAVEEGEEHDAVRKLAAEGVAGLNTLASALADAKAAGLEPKEDGDAGDSFQIVWGDGTVVQPSAEELAAAKAAAAEAAEKMGTESKLDD